MSVSFSAVREQYLRRHENPVDGALRTMAGTPWPSMSTVAWLAVACSKTAVCELMRIAWRTVGAIVARVWNDTEKSIDRFAGPAPDRHR